jgi:hypothetical protein
MLWDEFVAIPNGTRILNHNFDQCVALANLYHEQVIGGAFVPVASAYQWSTDFARYLQLTSNYTQLPSHANPEPGDIFVSRGGIYNSTDGHIGVVVRSWDGSTFGTKEQNAELNRYTYQTYNRSKANMLGYLRPKNNPTRTAQKEKFMRLTWSSTDGKGYLVTEDGFHYLSDMGQYNLFKRLIDATTAAPDSFNNGEIEFMNKVLRDMAKRNASAGAATDYAALAKAVNDDAAKRMQA